MLVASDALGAGATQMAAGHKARAATSRSHSGGEIKELDIEGLARGLEHCINVEVLAPGRPCGNMVDEVVVKGRVRANEGFDDPCDRWKSKYRPQGRGGGVAVLEGRKTLRAFLGSRRRR